MGDVKLRFIGSGNAFAPGGMCWNGFLLDNRILVEAPPQALMSVQRAGVNPNDLEAVLISHHHGDHFYGLPMLMLWWKWMGRTKPITIVGPTGTERITRDIAANTYPWLFEIAYPVTWLEVEPGETHGVAGISFTTHEMIHDETLSMCLGFGMEVNGRKIGYTGDTVFCPSVEALCAWSDVLLADCSSVEANHVHMSLLNDIPRVRTLMRPESHLVLTHIDPRVAAEGNMPGVSIAEDDRELHL
jgi:ribonuclease BN (tRNA processing enzyme)